MLDTWLVGKSRLRGAQSRAAAILSGAGLRANHVTIAGAAIGTLAAIAFAYRLNAAGLAALWLSAALDAVDGTMARDSERPTAMGGVLDLTADRLVEAAVLLGIAWQRPYLGFAALTVLASWYVNITVFLAVGAALETREKLIRYPPGLLERTEALVFFTLLIFAGRIGIGLCYAYAVLEIWTAMQRLGFARRELR
ncbi:MAG TPA: CDP-alcohol phosphatidyltransferase family protein [Candidatus Binataceae bacterium]|nr:CDP-alcohol phosphatidyltransferase family protein [Candidatus Binataceae bacterium]